MFMAMLIVSFIFFVMGIIGTLVGALSGYTVGLVLETQSSQLFKPWV